MSRIARVVLAGIPYHITQRGNARQQVFFDAQDYALYLDLLQSRSRVTGLRILAYCLMPNHVHLIAVPERADSMAAALGRTHAEFARHFNLRERSCGHVWQARYFSCPLDEPHLWKAMAYVERNPVRAGMTAHCGRYRWSSAPVRLGLGPDRGLVDLERWREEYSRERGWRYSKPASARKLTGVGYRRPAVADGRWAAANSCWIWSASPAARCTPCAPAARGRAGRRRNSGCSKLVFEYTIPGFHPSAKVNQAKAAFNDWKSIRNEFIAQKYLVSLLSNYKEA